ncbi:MAG: hypothetical protein IOC82_10865 [Aestuariivirga sp.]|uniref:DUF5330 domain-containing protein n=1 Tax=Aestuariivirga sp. TaxID=2650926 RepID=UPI0025B8048A|nr:DUF5330 domain-containing protein [Aestuariivirga sp.]MCA3561515.1 hypothetical protein [Aestuariivirga sp.]
MRVFRTIILLAAAGLLLPSPPEELAKGPDPDQPSTIDMLSSAGSAASDAWSFCSRQPDVCAMAGYMGSKLEGKLLYSASLLWGWAWDGGKGHPQLSGPSAAITVEGDFPPPSGAATDGQSTLGLDDLVPPWRGPAKEG